MGGLWLASAIVAEIGATLSLRASDGMRRKWWLLPVITGYLLAFVFLAVTLSAGMGIGVAYGVWTATGIALVAVLARAIWGDPLTRRMLLGIAVIAAVYFLVKFLNATDTPKIKGLPEIPGVPIFGNLIQLGTDHARVAQKWAAKYGPVFQTRLGNRVSARRPRCCATDSLSRA